MARGECLGAVQCCATGVQRLGACGACRAAASVTRYQPRFKSTVRLLTPSERRAMTGVTWRRGCPVALDSLRVIELLHWRQDGALRTGQLVVAARVAKGVQRAFHQLFRARFPVTGLVPMRHFGGSDDRSMAVDNTSAFNCRKMTGGSRWSEHTYGTAIDLNPLRNPYVRGKLVLPPAGREWTQRGRVRPGMLVARGPAVAAFRALGWGWGGTWKKLQDFQHLSESGR